MRKQPTMKGGSEVGVFLCLFWSFLITAWVFSALLTGFLATTLLTSRSGWWFPVRSGAYVSQAHFHAFLLYTATQHSGWHPKPNRKDSREGSISKASAIRTFLQVGLKHSISPLFTEIARLSSFLGRTRFLRRHKRWYSRSGGCSID